MPIDLEVDNLDNVPAALRDHYAPTADGTKYRLCVNGLEDGVVSRKALVAERGLLPGAKKLDAKLKQMGKSSDEVEQLLSAAETSVVEANKTVSTFLGDSVVEAALVDAKATAEGLRLLRGPLSARVKIEKGADGKHVARIMSADGQPMAGTGPNGSATFKDLIAEARKQFPGQFEAAGMGGGGAPRRQGTLPANTITRAEYERLPPGERASAARSMKIID